MTPGIVDASLLIGCAWTDGPYTSATVIVVAERDAQLAQRAARSLARDLWARRSEFRFGQETMGLDAAILAAMESPEHPVFLSDSGDNVTAGAAGDLPVVLGRLLARGARDALVAGLADGESVERCARAGEGAEVELSVGGKLDPGHGGPLPLRVRVVRLSADPDGRVGMATVRAAGVTVVLTADRTVFADRASILAAGVDPMRKRIVVVKQGYLFPDLIDHAPRAIMVLSPGASDLRIEELPYKRLCRPAYPLDGDFAWEP
jgi:microcystin degradation protein MlrC